MKAVPAPALQRQPLALGPLPDVRQPGLLREALKLTEKTFEPRA